MAPGPEDTFLCDEEENTGDGGPPGQGRAFREATHAGAVLTRTSQRGTQKPQGSLVFRGTWVCPTLWLAGGSGQSHLDGHAGT